MSSRPATEAERKVARALIAFAREQLEVDAPASGDESSSDSSRDND